MVKERTKWTTDENITKKNKCTTARNTNSFGYIIYVTPTTYSLEKVHVESFREDKGH